MTYKYHSNGKLLLTGEYLVLQGAESIALPLNKGQTMAVKPIEGEQIIWESYYNGDKILEAIFSNKNLKKLQTNDDEKADFIQQLLNKALEYIPALPRIPGYHIKTTLDFPFEWGLGSSSTLITNLAEWLNINPFRLNRDITKGSGYDIACAKSNNPILYKIQDKYPEYHEIDLSPPFQDHLYFFYTGRKKSSLSEVQKFWDEEKDYSHLFPEINAINHQIIQSKTLRVFENALINHEKIISSVLNKKTVQEEFFPDFKGVIKSLGAWGGDFVLVTWEGKESELKEYFNNHGMEIMFSWKGLVKGKLYE